MKFRFLFIFTLLSFSFYAPYKAYLNDNNHNLTEIIVVKNGDTILDTLNQISSTNIFHLFFLKIFIKFNNFVNFQSGEYTTKNINIKKLINNIVDGSTVTHKLIIREGATIYDLNELINNSKLINDCEMLSCIESKFGFKEGILYPDTYFYKNGMLASEILSKSHTRLVNYLENNIEKNIHNFNDVRKVLILASIIEKEAGNEKEKNDIASVFLKRLSINMKLQADPTIIYGLLPNFDGDIKKSDILDTTNKFNTYMIQGLPPSPISISSMSSIKAASFSKPGEYLFFVADSKTSHYFSKSYDEHLNKIKELRLDQ